MLGLPPCSSSQSNTLVALTIAFKTMFTKVQCLQNARTLYRVFTEHPNIYTMFTITSAQKAGLKQRLYLQAWQRARRKEVLKIESCSSFLEMENTPLGLGCMGDQMFPKSLHCQNWTLSVDKSLKKDPPPPLFPGFWEHLVPQSKPY